MALYGICISYPTQCKLSEQYCHGPKCGKGIFAFLDAGSEVGFLLPCREDECPIQEALLTDMPIDLTPEGQFQTGEKQIILRKLKPSALEKP